MSNPVIGYKVVKGVLYPDGSFGFSPYPDVHKARVGRQLPFGSMFVCTDKQRCVDYYAGLNTCQEGEHEFVLTLDCTGLVLNEEGVKRGSITEIEVGMPHLVEIERIDAIDTSKIRACPDCPFARSCKAGELGGSPVEKYLGQIIGPFFLPCHGSADYQGNDTRLATCSRQCAGAAVMRANIGIASIMPQPLLRLPRNHDTNVFNNLDEFVAHHRPELSAAERSEMLSKCEAFLLYEMRDAKVRLETT